MDIAFLQFLKYHTAGLVQMAAIIVFALPKVLAHFWKKVGEFLICHIQNAELFDAWRIDQVS
jgi:hypothetical protein